MYTVYYFALSFLRTINILFKQHTDLYNCSLKMSPSTSPAKRPRRPSKFIEGSPSTRPDLLSRTPTSNELFFNILSEMDDFEKKRQHQSTTSSVESFSSSNGAPSRPAEGRRSFGAARPILDHGEDKKSHGLKGRLRALTSGGKEKARPYSGT
jgi:hypothetical protein